MQRNTQVNKWGRSGNEGSVLLAAVVTTFVVTMVMGSYLYLASSEYRMATRSFMMGASFALAEGGIDQAMDALNDDDRSGWRVDGSTWTRTFTNGLDVSSGGTGTIRVVVLRAESATPTIYSEGTVAGHTAGDVTKQIKVDLTRGHFPFINGFNSKRGFILSGNNVTMDSYDSRNGDYGGGNVNSEISVSTIAVEVDAAAVGNADIYGYVATGRAQPDVGNNGSITSYSKPGVIDQTRITTDYYAEFPNVSAPTMTFPSESFPKSGEVSGGEYLIDSWSLSGKGAVTITGDVTLVVKGDLSLSGKASMTIAPYASLKIYAEGDVSIGGNGILNSSQKPKQLLVFGTNTTEGGQTLKIHGNGYLSAAVYAPNAVVELKGGGNSGRVYGAVVGYDAKLTGNSHFSYDEALGDYEMADGLYSVIKWVDLTNVTFETAQFSIAKYFP